MQDTAYLDITEIPCLCMITSRRSERAPSNLCLFRGTWANWLLSAPAIENIYCLPSWSWQAPSWTKITQLELFFHLRQHLWRPSIRVLSCSFVCSFVVCIQKKGCSSVLPASQVCVTTISPCLFLIWCWHSLQYLFDPVSQTCTSSYRNFSEFLDVRTVSPLTSL